jgi:hypothetical protein
MNHQAKIKGINNCPVKSESAQKEIAQSTCSILAEWDNLDPDLLGG